MMGRIKYNFTEEEMVQIYIDFSKKLGREYGASIDDFNGYSKKIWRTIVSNRNKRI